MLDRLEKGGLIERHPHPKDRRGIVLVLSGKATRELQALFEPLSTAMETLVSGYSEAQLDVLSDFFGRASAIWGSEREGLMGRTKAPRPTRR